MEVEVEVEPALGSLKLSVNSERVFYLCLLHRIDERVCSLVNAYVCPFAWLRAWRHMSLPSGGRTVVIVFISLKVALPPSHYPYRSLKVPGGKSSSRRYCSPYIGGALGKGSRPTIDPMNAYAK